MNIEEVASSYFQTDPTLLEPGAWSFSAGFSRHRTPQRKTPQQSTQSTRHPTGNWEGLIGLIRLILVVEFNQLIAIWDSGFVILLPQSSCGPETRITMVPGIATKTAARPVAWAPQPRNMFVFGAGFVGRYVSERLLAQGWLVTLTPHSCPAHFILHVSLPIPFPPCFSPVVGRRRKSSPLLPNFRSPSQPDS